MRGSVCKHSPVEDQTIHHPVAPAYYSDTVREREGVYSRTGILNIACANIGQLVV